MRDHTDPQRQDDLSISETCHVIEVDPATNDLSAAQQAVSERIAGLLNIDGLIFPCHMATISANGAGSIVRYSSNKSVITLAQHLESEGLVTPFHCLLMDSTGFTARLCQSSSEIPPSVSFEIPPSFVFRSKGAIVVTLLRGSSQRRFLSS